MDGPSNPRGDANKPKPGSAGFLSFQGMKIPDRTPINKNPPNGGFRVSAAKSAKSIRINIKIVDPAIVAVAGFDMAP